MNFFVTKIVEDSDVTYNLTVAGYVALAAVMLVVFAAGCMFRDKNKKMDAKQIASAPCRHLQLLRPCLKLLIANGWFGDIV